MSVKISRLAVQSNVFPLYEVVDGTSYTLNFIGDKPVKDYMKVQGRFQQLTDDDFEGIQGMVDNDFALLQTKVQCSSVSSTAKVTASRRSGGEKQV